VDHIREFVLAGKGMLKRASIDMTAVSAVEELNPAVENDSATCLIYHPDRQEPFRVTADYVTVHGMWMSATVMLMTADA
jgi:hypothetical protein